MSEVLKTSTEGEQFVDEVYRIMQDYTFDVLDDIESRLLALKGTESSEIVQSCVDKLAEILQVGFEKRFAPFERTVLELFASQEQMSSSEKQSQEFQTTKLAAIPQIDLPQVNISQQPPKTEEESKGKMKSQQGEYERLANEIADLRIKNDLSKKRIAQLAKRIKLAKGILLKLQQLHDIWKQQGFNGTMIETVEELTKRSEHLVQILSKAQQTLVI